MGKAEPPLCGKHRSVLGLCVKTLRGSECFRIRSCGTENLRPPPKQRVALSFGQTAVITLFVDNSPIRLGSRKGVRKEFVNLVDDLYVVSTRGS